MNFDLSTGIEFMLHGIFEAPDGEWVHMSREMDSYEVFCVTDGVLYISDGKEDYIVNAGEYLITAPCENQHGTLPSECRFYYFHFHAADIDGAFPYTGNFEQSDIEKYYHFLSAPGITKDIQGHIMAAVLLELGNKERNLKNSDAGEELCANILAYIRLAQPELLKVSAIAGKFQYNEKYISACFKRKTGMSLKKHLKAEIISRAKHLLKYTNDSISEIGEELGYGDPQSFSHIFKNTVGLAPSEYRKRSIST